MEITIAEGVMVWVEEQAREERYGSPEDYVLGLIEAERERQGKALLRKLIEEGLNSGPPILVDENYWELKRTQLADRLKRPKRS